MVQRSSPSTRSPWERTPQVAGRSFLSLFFILLLLLSTCKGQTPPGWTISRSGPNSIYQPTDLPPGKSFTLTIEPLQNLSGQSLSQWFAQHTESDLTQRGTVLSQGTPRSGRNGLTVVDSFRDSSGQQWIALYAAVPRPDGSIQFSSMISNLSVQETSRYMNASGAILGAMARTANANPQENQQPVMPPPSRSPQVRASSPLPGSPSRPQSREDQAITAIRVAQPGTGVQPAQIEAILHEGRGMSTASGYQYVESADLLLKDGWEYSDLKVPPEDLDVRASRQLQPEQWHRWRVQGQEIYIQDQRSGQWSKLEADRALPLRSAFDQHLIYRHSTGFGGMGSFNTRSDITFHGDGSFERSSSTLAGSGVVQAGAGFSAGTSSYRDRNGCSSTTTGTYSNNNGSSVGTYSSSHCRPGQDPNSYGTYKIHGYTLELDSASGQVQRVLAFYPFPNKPQIYIDSVTYSLPDKFD